ncbi:Arfaptin-2 [Merluccius polli]|uniref:Arfaptin-2 n=1 Tax=Merluccius polli TaxID=89951 RepID=A0AA47M4G1_MERPO|nr:Arfaptin-2 [Merluccius polli]
MEDGSPHFATTCRDKTNGKLVAVQKCDIKEFQRHSKLHHNNVIKVQSQFEMKDEEAENTAFGVFELMDHSIRDDMREQPQGLESQLLKKYAFQILLGIEYLHSVNVIHLDIKPHNLLVSRSGVVKVSNLCSHQVLHRYPLLNAFTKKPILTSKLWFMSPEAITGGRYSTSHDVWSIGRTLLAMAKPRQYRLVNTSPLNHLSDIVSQVGPLTARQQRGCYKRFRKNGLARDLPPTDPQQKYELSDPLLAQLVDACLKMDPKCRATCSELLHHPYFTRDSFHKRFPQELAAMILADGQGHHDPYTAGPSCSTAISPARIWGKMHQFPPYVPLDSVSISIDIPEEAVLISPDVPLEAVEVHSWTIENPNWASSNGFADDVSPSMSDTSGQSTMTDSIMSKAATMEIPINSNGDTGTLPEDDSLEQATKLQWSLDEKVGSSRDTRDLQQVMVSGPNLNETSIVSGGYGGTAEGIIPTSSIKGPAIHFNSEFNKRIPNTGIGSNINHSSSSSSLADDANRGVAVEKLEYVKKWGLNTYKCTKQMISERFGRGSRTVDLELEAQIEVLRDTKRKYENMLRLARALTNHFYSMVQTQHALGDTFADLSQKSPELRDEFGYNAETQKLLCKNGETLLGAVNFFVSSINTLVNKTMEDTLLTIKLYENARLEFDAYRADLEELSLGPRDAVTMARIDGAQQQFQVHKDKYEQLRNDVTIKLKFLEENKVKVMHKQLLLFHNAISAYFAGNQQQLEQTLQQFNIKLKPPGADKPSWLEEQ